MRYLVIVLIYITISIFFYLLFAAIGCIWFSFKDIINCAEWNIIYWVGIHWIIAIPACIEIYEIYLEDK